MHTMFSDRNLSVNTHIPLRYCLGFVPIRTLQYKHKDAVIMGQMITRQIIEDFPGDPSLFIVHIRPETNLELKIRNNIEQVEREEEAKLQRIVQKLTPGEYLFEQDDPDKTIYILLEGELEIIMDGSLIATINEPGTFIGEMSIIRGMPRSASVRSRTDAKLYCIDGSNLLLLAQEHPVILSRLCKVLANKIATTSTELSVLKMMGNPEKTHVIYEPINEDSAFLDSVKKNKNKIIEYEKDEILFQEGETSFEIFILVTGEVKVTIGGETIARISSPGMIIGEMSSLRLMPRSATLTATGPSSFYKILGIRLLEACKEHPEFFIKLAQILSNRLNETSHEYAHFLKVYEE